jgi:hypothetical protein
MLPTGIEYPLFAAALQRFTERQPDPVDIASYLSAAGLVATRRARGLAIELPKQQWMTIVANRFMSLLSTFNDNEIEEGIREIEQNLAGVDTVRFRNDFEFVVGRSLCSKFAELGRKPALRHAFHHQRKATCRLDEAMDSAAICGCARTSSRSDFDRARTAG